MDWKDWEPWYLEITDALGLDKARDTESARLLGELLRGRVSQPDVLESLLKGREVTVLGPAPFSDHDFGDSVLVSAGSAAERLLCMGIVPHISVTDLDGNVRAQVKASQAGAVTVIHAHGDNMPALREWVPRFRSPVIGTTQARPFGVLHNFGGFTDGDRAVFLATHFGACRITLRGFDFRNPVGKPGTDIALKKRKLACAHRLIEHARETYGIEIVP